MSLNTGKSLRIVVMVCLALFIATSFCMAHKATGVNPNRTLAYMAQVEDYFERTYGIVLHNEITVHVAKSYKQYRRGMGERNTENPRKFAQNTQGVTSADHTILINDEELSDEQFFFVLAHEMVHQYQYEYWPNWNSDYVQLEGQADIVASQISGYPVSIRDHGIPYKNFVSREQYFKEVDKDSQTAMEQIRYYASQSRFL